MTFDDVNTAGPVPVDDEPMHDPNTSADGNETAEPSAETERAEG